MDGNLTGQKLLTPESWNSSTSSTGDARNQNVSPKGSLLIHRPMESTSVSSSESSSSPSSLRVSVSGLRSLERSIQPSLPTMDTPPHPAALPPPLPPRPSLDQKPLPQIPIPFIRPPLHAQGLKSPLANPPRHAGPSSSPIHRPPHSPLFQPPTSCSINPPGLVHPFPGAYFPGLHSPPLNLMPRGPVPVPPIMNYGIPSFGPLLPQPTVLVPYPIIVPLPVPIPIPIPIPVPPKTTLEMPNYGGVIQPVPEGVDRGRSRTTRSESPDISDEASRVEANKQGGNFSQSVSLSNEPSPKDIALVKSERQFLSPLTTPQSKAPSPRAQCSELSCQTKTSEGLTDYKIIHQQTERQVIQRVLQRTQVKLEPSANGMVDLAALGESGHGQIKRPGFHNIIRPNLTLPQSPSNDFQQPDSLTLPSNSPHSPIESSHLHDAKSSTQNHSQNGTSSSSTTSGMDSSSLQRLPVTPQDPSLNELEAIKENKCSVVCPVLAEGPVSQLEGPLIVSGDVEEDSHVPDEDHAYALPTAPKTGGTTPPLLLPKLRDKAILRSPTTMPSAAEMEPALKRRCLRIRDQNK